MLKMGRPKRGSHRNTNSRTNHNRKITSYRTDRCVNPMRLVGHRGYELRKVPKVFLQKFRFLRETDKICNPCRKRV